jgi:peptidoglycan/LPS O-acetylase OafA/YrhL
VNALIPCLGTACLIWAGPSHPLARLLTNPLAIRIGLISYSLYLVHWPLIVYAAYILGDAAHAVGPKLGVFALALALSELMYRTVETPFRARRSSLVSVAGYAGAAIVAIASVSFIANRQDGWPCACRRKRARSLICSGSGSGLAAAARSRNARSVR